MKKISRKYLALMEAARELFWKHGFRRVSVEEVCHKALVSKMTFYRYFPNKMELAKAVYDKVADEGIENFKEIMADERTSPADKMQQMLQMKLEGTNDISQEFLKDFYSNPELGLSAYVEEKSRLAWNEIIRDFRHAQEKGWLRKDFKPELFLIVTSKMSEMITDETLLKMYDSPQELVMELSRLFTFGIMPDREEK
ncbi:MAG: TetR/AcrR family transcriptional regulator [Bacteroidales bacterium]|nr:TetR/AcrR family transcriptional regulator [Bacteroidales bacterium]